MAKLSASRWSPDQGWKSLKVHSLLQSPVLGWVWLLPEKQRPLLQSISYCLSYFRAVRPPKAPLVLYLAVVTMEPLPEGFSYSEAGQKENWAQVRLLGALPGNPVSFIEAEGSWGCCGCPTFTGSLYSRTGSWELSISDSQ